MSSTWAKGCMFDDCVCVISPAPPWWVEKKSRSYIIIIIIDYFQLNIRRVIMF